VADVGKVAEGIQHHDAERQQIVQRKQNQQRMDDEPRAVPLPAAGRAQRIEGGGLSHGASPRAGAGSSRSYRARARGRARPGS
jgi:hypothetical protein